MSEIVTFVKWTKRINELLCMCISYLCLVNMHNYHAIYVHVYTGCAKKKKDILNIHIKSEGINIFLQKICWTESTIILVKCQKFTFMVQLFMT